MNADLLAVKSLVSGFAFNPEGALMWTPPGAATPEPLSTRPIDEVRTALISASQAVQAVVQGQGLPHSLEAAAEGVKRPWQVGYCDNGNLLAFEAPEGMELQTQDVPEYGITNATSPAKSNATTVISTPIIIQEGLMVSAVMMTATAPSNLFAIQTTILLEANAHNSNYIIVIPQNEVLHFWQMLRDLQGITDVKMDNKNDFVIIAGACVSMPQNEIYLATPAPLARLFRAVTARIAEEQRGV